MTSHNIDTEMALNMEELSRPTENEDYRDVCREVGLFPSIRFYFSIWRAGDLGSL